jgi:serine/threonine protein kinase
MTTRDPRSPEHPTATPSGDAARESTQSLDVPLDAPPEPAALALGTHNRQITRIESPNGRGKTPAPPHRGQLGHGGPEDYLDAVLGSYRIVELLGKGGMGYVYRAEHTKLGREVALKLLRSDYASRRDAVARFFQEARTVNRVRHRNIVDVTDFVELDDGSTYIIMELLTGTSLGAWARSGVDLPRALAVLVQICDGLGAAHDVGVVHRDLKPDNVIIVPTADGAELAKLLDFGVAKLLNRDDEDVGFQTAAGSVIGTPAYMSPEQAGGMVVDARSDIYSLGAIMYELFCGQPMFRGRSFGEYVRKHLTETPEPPRQTPGGAGIAPELEAVILRCLDKDPDQRFARIVELRDALLTQLGGSGPLPPSLVGLTSSGLRATPPQLPHLPATLHAGGEPTPSAQLPLRSAVSGSAGFSQISGAHPSQIGAQPGSPPTATSPWWVWFAGGALAVGAGIAAAIWYAGPGRPELAESAPASVPPVSATAHPTAQPIDPPTPRAAPVEVRFDARPSGAVFAEGRPVELCRTPCAFRIDPTDGGPTDRRGFVVKRDGYSDGAVTVDLAGGSREFQVELHRAPPPAAHADSRLPETRTDRRPVRHPAKPARPGHGAARDAVVKDSVPRAPTARDARPARDAGIDHLIDPSDGAAAPPQAPTRPDAKPATRTTAKTAIDPADTLDPFHQK